ncbi:3-methyl-2-oxobutanoate hydroxymethyltransferase [Miltoncostaea marina]|uniref:3-methyl-2-oxobutanoate hydroxymethyltransferase n=1 Tax=Miltoncostaea marina TaxID=2843215 RepID=UPI001C3E0695|nr:3-methyl-2-oxobutanoate hydroxymethyltransferase [Miltoncostaea marina]
MTTPLSAAAIRARKGGARLVMLTAYDYPTARALDESGLDILLVGDSLGEVELGYDTTRAVSLEMMAHHVRAVRNGASATHVCGDLTAGSYATPGQAVASARRLVEAGADSVKLEGGLVAQVEAIIAAGIPVIGHVGLLPQTAEVYRREGTTPEEADRIAAEARALDAAGVCALVIEAVPAELAERITAEVGCPTIGIAAGPECDGQVLVVTDLVGGLPSAPRFVKPKADVYGAVVGAARAFAAEVRGAAAAEARRAV